MRPEQKNRPLLVVDDDEHIRLTLAETLTPLGLPLMTAEDGLEALAKLEQENPLLVLLDLKMPKMGGMEVLRHVRMQRPDVPVIIITAHGDIESAVEAVRLGAVSFLQKPFSIREVRALVIHTLDHEARAEEDNATYELHLEKARDAIKANYLEAALKHARQALGLNAARPEAFNLIGVAMQLQMNVAEAQKYYRSALALDHTYAAARDNLENISSYPKKLSRYDLG